MAFLFNAYSTGIDGDQFGGQSEQDRELQEGSGILFRLIISTPPPYGRSDTVADVSDQSSHLACNRSQNLEFIPWPQAVAGSWRGTECLSPTLPLSTDRGVSSGRVPIPQFQETASVDATVTYEPLMALGPSTYIPTDMYPSSQVSADQLEHRFQVPSIAPSHEASIGHSLLCPDSTTTLYIHQQAVAHHPTECSNSTAYNPFDIADLSSQSYPVTQSLRQGTNVNMDHHMTPPSYSPSAYLASPSRDHLTRGSRRARRTNLGGLVTSTNVSFGMEAENLRLTGHLAENDDSFSDGRTNRPDYFNFDSWQLSTQDIRSHSASSSSGEEFPVERTLHPRRLSASDAESTRCTSSGFFSTQMNEASGSGYVHHRTPRPVRSLDSISAGSTLSNDARPLVPCIFAPIPLRQFSHPSNVESLEVNDGSGPPVSMWSYRDGSLLPPATSPVYTADTPSDCSYGTALSPMSVTPSSVSAGDEFPPVSPSSYGQTTPEGEGGHFAGIVDLDREKRGQRPSQEVATGRGRNGKRPRSGQAGPSESECVASPAVRGAASKRRKCDANIRCEVCPETFTREANLQYHMLAHNGEKPFPCQVAHCASRFRQRQDLRRHHKKVHEKKRPKPNRS
ncbi:hypothetical protein JAAARDRAFT_407538 [Jaapia argillacea MUCL 33604]|uniref:C2H2-type domain-containing protein n=1 Tax=Jaapia argillacea MUCL 33604 TaxID=933084 RepID=A0A067PHX9_9AGAM|nr:hypothetical protein JAAARDRAFT_407538 [Jaapia argillacea MUCL 33604]